MEVVCCPTAGVNNLGMQEICRTALQRWEIKKIAVAHRTGTVGIGEPSVIIAVSSAHRSAALQVCFGCCLGRLLHSCLRAVC